MRLQASVETPGKVWALGQVCWIVGDGQSSGNSALGEAGVGLAASLLWFHAAREMLLWLFALRLDAWVWSSSLCQGRCQLGSWHTLLAEGGFPTACLTPCISQPSKPEAAFRTFSGCQSLFLPKAKATSSWFHLTAALMSLITADWNCAKATPAKRQQQSGLSHQGDRALCHCPGSSPLC